MIAYLAASFLAPKITSPNPRKEMVLNKFSKNVPVPAIVEAPNTWPASPEAISAEGLLVWQPFFAISLKNPLVKPLIV